MVCGETLFHVWHLYTFLDDLGHECDIDAPEGRQRRREINPLEVSQCVSELLAFLQPRFQPRSIWDRVEYHRTASCSDPRDYVFGLLSLTDQRTRTALKPDYAKSVTEVLLELLEYKAECDGEVTEEVSWRFGRSFYQARNVVGSFGLRCDDQNIIAAMRDRRRIFFWRRQTCFRSCRKDAANSPRKH